MKTIVSIYLALTLTFAVPKQPRQPHSFTREQILARWYMAEDGHAVKCTGKPRTVLYRSKDGVLSLRRAVLGCYGPQPQILLKD
jgi:hypothetical protein